MDQLKVYLGHLKKHHFWLVVLLVIIVGFIVRRQAGEALNAAYEVRKGEVDRGFTQVNQIVVANNPPNDSFSKGVDELHKQVKQDTNEAWQFLYRPQAEQFVWPKLTNTFVADMAKLKPTEEIPQYMRESYKNYMSKEIPGLIEIIQPVTRTKEPINSEEPRKDGEKPAEQEVVRGLVDWDNTDKAALENRYKFGIIPTTKGMRIAQEDYWLYESLLDLIARTNGDATNQATATVPQILNLAIAQRAIDLKTGSPGITVLASGAAPRKAPPVAVPGADADDAALEKDRYVDATGKQVANRAASGPQFTLIPFYMQIVIDQRKLPEFLANCGNAILPMKVLQMTVPRAGNPFPGNQTVSKATTAPAAQPGTGMAGFSQMGSGTQRSTSGSNQGQKANVTPASNANLRPHDMLLQLYGTIRVLNPPAGGMPAPTATAGETDGGTPEATGPVAANTTGPEDAVAPDGAAPGDAAADGSGAPPESDTAPAEDGAEPAPENPTPEPAPMPTPATDTETPPP